MVVAHVTDAWTRDADRHDNRYAATVFVNGLAAPLFMLLAGTALTMAAGRRARRDGAPAAGRAAWSRGWQVFGLAFLFRIQSQVLGWGAWVNLLKVDILNVMGVSMVVAAALWRLLPSRVVRIFAYAAATAACVYLAPVVPGVDWLAALPDPLEWYVRPGPYRWWFTLFPWMGFLMAGALIGELLEVARTIEDERRLHAGLAVAATVSLAGGWAASTLLPPGISPTDWAAAPPFFFIRLGIVVAGIPLAWLLSASWEPLVTLGRSSLFVYWVHVEMAYGALALPIARALPWEVSVTAAALLLVFLYRLVHWKDEWVATRGVPHRLRIFAPVLK